MQSAVQVEGKSSFILHFYIWYPMVL